MSGSRIPNEPPPSYDQVTGSSTSSSRPHASSHASHTAGSHLEVPGSKNDGIPAHVRRSMEDESRPLPEGWVRTFDPIEQHQFFVDTTKDPPRSTWVHPYDDEDYLRTLPTEERERIEQQESFGRGKHPHTSKADIMAAHTDDEDEDDYLPHHYQKQGAAAGSSSAGAGSSHIPNELPPPEGKGKSKDDTRSFGRKFKDKVTGMTHEERERERARRAKEEEEMYRRHMAIRQAMAKAAQTGQPQYMGKDNDGKDIYIEPPAYAGGGYPGGGYGVNPYRGGVYTTPNARYIRPPMPYGRPMGYGYGGGYGMPMAPMMLGGGLLGGALLGSALF